MTTPSIRCVILVGTVPGLEGGRTAHTREIHVPAGQSLSTVLAHHSVGFTADAAALEDNAVLAAHLRELADILTAPTIPDPEIL